MKRTECDSFLQGYLDAALWTTDNNSPGGVDYAECGRADEMFPRLPDYFIEQARKDCAEFQRQNGEDLKAFCPCDSQNGHDFWLTRNGHGTGFWDREQTQEKHFEEIANRLTEAADKFGEEYLFAEDIGQTEKACKP